MEAKPRGRWIVLLVILCVLQACGDSEVLGLFRGVPSLAVSITTPTNGQSFLTNSLTASGTATDYSGTGLEGVYASLDGGGFVRFTTNSAWSTNVAALADGPHTLRIYARDNNGYCSFTNQVGFSTVLDTWAPTVTITSHSNGQTVTNSSFLFSGTAADVGSGVAAVWFSLDGGAFARTAGTVSWSTNLSITSNGTHTLRVYATDLLGYHSATNQVTIEMADYGQWASTYTIIVANGENIRISTNGWSNFYAIGQANRFIVGCAVDSYRNIYVTATNTGSSSGYYGTVKNFAGSISYNGWTSGNHPGVCAVDDYGHFYAYEINGLSDGAIFSGNFGITLDWIDNSIIGVPGQGVCYVAANRGGVVVLARSDGSLSIRYGGSGVFTNVSTGTASGAHQLALIEGASPVITFIHNGQWVRSSAHGYNQYDAAATVTALRYHGTRLWFGFQSGSMSYSDNHGQSLIGVAGAGLPGVAITALAIDSTGRIFAGTVDGRLYMSSNNGTDFSGIATTWGSYITQIYIAD